MVTAERAKEIKENVLKTFRRQPHSWVPVMPRVGTALMDYSGTNYWEMQKHPDDMPDVMLKIFADGMPADCITSAKFYMCPEFERLLHGCVQSKLSEDGITLQHLQNSQMNEDEYPLAIKDLDNFIKNTLIRRKMPFLFDMEVKDAARLLEQAVDARAQTNAGAMGQVGVELEKRYGTYLFADGRGQLTTPGDIIFDNYRGFKGTLTDLRRHYEEMKEFSDVLWEKGYARDFNKMKLFEDKYICYMAHIPAFLNQKQYNDLCYKYFKRQMTAMDAQNSKLYILAEGKWEHLFDFMLDLPKDCLVMNVENDDVCTAYKAIGHHQILIGGSLLVDTKMNSLEYNKDQVRRVMDTCAPGNAFIFGSDKSWCCKGDVNETLLETFKFAAEYGKY